MASLTETQIRTWLKERYPHSTTWHRKVDKMGSSQVIAIYYRMQGNVQPKEAKEKSDVSAQQLTLF